MPSSGHQRMCTKGDIATMTGLPVEHAVGPEVEIKIRLRRSVNHPVGPYEMALPAAVRFLEIPLDVAKQNLRGGFTPIGSYPFCIDQPSVCKKMTDVIACEGRPAGSLGQDGHRRSTVLAHRPSSRRPYLNTIADIGANPGQTNRIFVLANKLSSCNERQAENGHPQAGRAQCCPATTRESIEAGASR